MTPDSLIAVGRIIRSRGLRGEVVVLPLTDNPEQFRDLQEVFLTRADGSLAQTTLSFVRFSRRQGRTEIHLTVKGAETREAADELKGSMISLTADSLSLSEDEYLLSDLEGFEVVTASGEKIGVVKEIRRLPAQDLIVLESMNGSEVLIPDVAEFVDKSALDDRKLIVTPIEGLLAV